jgi:hypothetical protein
LDTLQITSRLDTRYHQNLEELLFFHPRQDRFKTAIMQSVSRYGMPEICTNFGLLRISLGGEMLAQSLYALTQGEQAQVLLRGAVIYIRDTSSSLAVLHMTIAEECDGLNNRCIPAAGIMWRMLGEIRDSAARIRGIETIKIIYGEGDPGKGHAWSEIPVVRDTTATLQPGGHRRRLRLIRDKVTVPVVDRTEHYTPPPSAVLVRSHS